MKEIIFLLFIATNNPAPHFDSTKVQFVKSAIREYPVVVASKDSVYLADWIKKNGCQDCLLVNFRKMVAVKSRRTP